MYELDELSAFDAMVRFRKEYATQTNSVDVSELIDELHYSHLDATGRPRTTPTATSTISAMLHYSHLDATGRPILGDQGDWGDWIRAVREVAGSATPHATEEQNSP
jgi:hypothetical protein